ncbi:xanthine dehydrogenase molybdenum binding subunit apoprotein [Humitalea rosea]|uniref:Xanthine dehydrogenase molybdenum binding subunit apoprotein n=1 Tax=Humitalea rosea TaxID=990373 RepID=A0A2W7ITC6_9PROT|nr:xanthine dehydrogenase family protein molybdopterin-binding subunit [Humitalea rosea]PZW50509.1 xanthine dehydrogenase molybdenum binding subunit apoprotein [Humitalea rosea]
MTSPQGVRAQGVGASLLRKEDARFLHGRGRYVADITLPGMLEVAFLRSPVAHARLLGMTKPEGAAERVFTFADLDGVGHIRAVSGLPGFRISEQPVLATDKLRHVGEAIAACVAPSRACAEDLVAACVLDYEELPVVSDMLSAGLPGTALVHEHWSQNAFLETTRQDDLSELDAIAAAKVTRRLRTSRQCMAPLEGRGVLVEWDPRLEQLIVTTSTQMPHVSRTGLAEILGLDEGQVRVIAPDVGGGFGYKGILLPEEVVCAHLAIRLGRPVRWIEDRLEHLTANANCREHHYIVTAWADAGGRLLGAEVDATVDAGAYSSYPFGACLEAAQIGSIFPGPYTLPKFSFRTVSACTNKPPILPYRGVARTGVCYALETTMDALARKLGISATAIRLANLVPPEAMPYRNLVGKVFDSGDYPEALRRAMASVDLAGIRARQAAGECVGFGLAVFCEQGAHGTSVYAGWGVPIVPGFEQATARFSPDGVLEIRTGVHSHGQGMETTLAQVAHEVLGVETARVRVVHGDTALTPYSTGTWGSRGAVMAGGAVAEACRLLGERALAIGAALLQAEPGAVELSGGAIRRRDGGAAVTLAEIARTWYRQPQNLARDVDKGGLEVIAGYRPDPDTGTHSYACHAVTLRVDRDTGEVAIEDYLVVEDGGTLLNPMIVDGQVLGGVAQGIGTALYEEMPFDAAGQPLAGSLADYLLPGATEVPDIRLDHMETPSPWTRFGQKGIGESGAIGPPAAIVNAINDALHRFGAEVLDLPATPARVLAALEAAR